jgi:hypothetical protein
MLTEDSFYKVELTIRMPRRPGQESRISLS